MRLRPLIRERRMEKHLTQKQFAELLGTRQGVVSRWENGHDYPSLPYLIKIEKILDCTLQDLFEAEE